MTTHDAIVTGYDETGKLVFIRTYDTKADRKEMLAAYDYVSATFDSYLMQTIERFAQDLADPDTLHSWNESDTDTP